MHGPPHSRERKKRICSECCAQSSLTVCLVFQVARQFFPKNPSICVKRVFFFKKREGVRWGLVSYTWEKVSDNIIRLFSHAVFFSSSSFKMLKLEFLFIEWVVGGDKYYTVVDGDKRQQSWHTRQYQYQPIGFSPSMSCLFFSSFLFLVCASVNWLVNKSCGRNSGRVTQLFNVSMGPFTNTQHIHLLLISDSRILDFPAMKIWLDSGPLGIDQTPFSHLFETIY